MPQRGTTSSPMEAPAVAAPARQTGWRGWWSRWRSPAAAPAATPARAPAATFDPDLPIETSRRVGPERDIWPDRSHGSLSRLLPPSLRPKAGDGPTLGLNQPTPKMTAAEANRAIASLARPRKSKTDDDFVLPVRMGDDADEPTLMPTPTFVDDQAPSELPAPIPVPSPFIERFSTLSEPKLDPAARNTSGAERSIETNPAEDAGPPPLVSQEPDPESTPALVAVAQTPPPPPLRPSPRVDQPPPPVESTSPAAPPLAQPAEPADEAPPVKPDEPSPEAPSPSLPVAPPSDAAEAAVAPSAPTPEAQGRTPAVAAPQMGQAVAPTLVASAGADAPKSHQWSFLKWLRPNQHEPKHLHHPGVFPSPQGPVELPPVLVPTSYHASLAGRSGSSPSRQDVTPTMQQAFVMPSPQCPPTPSQPKKPCALVTRLHERMDQYRQWKHAHICKHIQGLKDMLAGRNRCEACGGTGAGPTPSAQGAPSPQARPSAPTPQAQAQSQSRSLLRLGATG